MNRLFSFKKKIEQLSAQVDRLTLFAEVVGRSTFGIVITDSQGLIEYVNPCLCRQSGYLLEELEGRNARIFQSGKTADAVYRSMWATILAGNIWYGELLNRKKDGTLYWEFVHIAPVLGEGGEIRHFFTIKEEQLSRQQGGRIEDLAVSIDPLTGLLNRSGFHLRLEQALGKGSQGPADGDLSLVHIDLDRFDSFNQALGHTAADRLLVAVGQRLRRFIRREDELARIGGDEFALLLHHNQDQEARDNTVERLRALISQPICLDEHELMVTASMGVASSPLHGRDPQTLLNSAHSAMIVAKQEGGDTVCFYELVKKGVAANDLELASTLRQAIDRDELVLHYQPQVSLVSGEIVGLEALVRWHRPGIGLVPPGIFIPVAERSGLITLIGKWVLGAAVAQIVAWRQEGVPLVKVAVNLSAHHFHNETLPDFVAALLRENGVPAKYLELEMTESAMMRDVVRTRGIVERLKDIGVSLSLDDFGTGHSSLAYLSHFPIDLLKIDQGFVGDVTTNPINASIVAATIAMAHKLGKCVIAEGVETEAQMSFLRRHDCDQMQGFLFSRPCPADEIGTMLRQARQWQFAPESQGCQQTLLLVDDEPYVLSGLTRVFHRQGYRLLTATNGLEALALLAVNPVEVIISDQRMPDMTGIELLSRVKELYPDTVRIILSGYAESATVTEAINRGAIWKYFTKPWPEDSLRQAVRQAFQMKSRG